MTPAEALAALGGRVLALSLQASLLILLILLVRALVRNRWPARWQASLWVLLVATMVIPGRPTISRTLVGRLPAVAAPGRVLDPGPGAPRVAAPRRGGAPGALARRPFPVLAALWLAGMALLLLRMAQVNAGLWLAVRRGRALTSEPALELLEACRETLGIRTLLPVVLTDRVPGPALFGFLRPRLLLPPALVEGLSGEELRHVFLHELTHLRRLDIHFGWLGAALQVLHWFNPLVWAALHQMRGDRELACDEEVVSRLAPQETPAYGRTLIRLLEPVPPALLPCLAGVAENGAHFKRRIRMIAAFAHAPQRSGRPWTWSSSLVFAAVALCAVGVRMRAEDPAVPGKPIVDRIDYPFVSDPALPGGWRTVDFVPDPADFDPAVRRFTRDFFLKELFVKPDGTTNWAWKWTRGLFLHPGDHTASRYEVRALGGKTYLFLEWKSGDYTYLHRKPQFYVLVRDERLVIPEVRVTDRIDYPFVDDPEVLGKWVTVDFVETPGQFDPAHRSLWGEAWIQGLEFLKGGGTSRVYRGAVVNTRASWTRGLVLDPEAKTASGYQLLRVNGRTYLFFENKNGDYTLRAQKPRYFVLQRAVAAGG